MTYLAVDAGQTLLSAERALRLSVTTPLGKRARVALLPHTRTEGREKTTGADSDDKRYRAGREDQSRWGTAGGWVGAVGTARKTRTQIGRHRFNVSSTGRRVSTGSAKDGALILKMHPAEKGCGRGEGRVCVCG